MVIFGVSGVWGRFLSILVWLVVLRVVSGVVWLVFVVMKVGILICIGLDGGWVISVVSSVLFCGLSSLLFCG